MNYTQSQFNNAIIKDKAHYLTLDNPQFEGQTRADSEGNYKMYFSCNGELYGYEHNLFS